MFKSSLATTAKAKIVKNKKLKTLRLVIAFNVYEVTEKGTYKFPAYAKCDYVSGDLQIGDVLNATEEAKALLRTNNIQFVS